MASRFDPITLEILWRRLISIVDEADGTVARTAFSSLLRDAHDYTCMFTDRKGRELAQGSFATPGQSGAMALGIKNLVTRFPLDVYKPGDVFITNDPWALAGHLNDVCVMSPIFYEGKARRLHRVRIPPFGYRRPRLLGQPRRLRGGPVHPPRQALRRRGPERVGHGDDPVERADARRGHRRHPVADRG